MPLLPPQMLPLSSAWMVTLLWLTTIGFSVGHENSTTTLQISYFIFMQSTWALQMLEKFSAIELHDQPCLDALTTCLIPCRMSQISQILLQINQVKLRCLILISCVKPYNEGITFLCHTWFLLFKICWSHTSLLSNSQNSNTFLP